MRTTLNLSDDLVEDAKQTARAEGRTLTSFIEEAMRARLRQGEADEIRPMPTFGEPGTGGLRVDILDADALNDILDEAP